VLELDEEDRYRVRIFEQRADGGEFFVVSETYPRTGSNDGDNFLRRIPFIFVNPLDLSPAVYKSPILDIVNANIAHFRLSADYENGLFLTAQPTPVVSGWPDGTPSNFRFGGGNIWLLPEGAKAEILEFHGDGLQSLERALIAKENQIAELGAHLLQSAESAPETAQAVRIRQHDQTSVISSIARTISDAFKLAIEIACKWAFAPGRCKLS
jgi:hypothetical protein